MYCCVVVFLSTLPVIWPLQSSTVVCKVIGVILANTHEQATQAARKVVVVYEDLPAVVSIEEAIAAKSFYPGTHEIISGD